MLTSYRPTDVKILGALEYGETGASVLSLRDPRYHAFVFSGYGGDIVDVTVTGSGRTGLVVLADSTLNQLATGDTHIGITLPYRGPDIEVWYVLYQEAAPKPAHFSVHVKKLGNILQKVQARADSPAAN